MFISGNFPAYGKFSPWRILLQKIPHPKNVCLLPNNKYYMKTIGKIHNL